MRWELINEMTTGDCDVSSLSGVVRQKPVCELGSREKLGIVSINNTCKEFFVKRSERNGVVANELSINTSESIKKHSKYNNHP